MKRFCIHLSVLLLIGFISLGKAQALDKVATNSDSLKTDYKFSVDFCPMSPLFKIYAVHLCYKLDKNDELIVAPYYANIHHKGIGNTNAPGFIVGYRRYLWKSLHVDYQLMPQWDRYYSSIEDKTYPLGFDLWNEFRLGYVFDFKIVQTPCFINCQWPFGFALYSDPKGKPESFKKMANENQFFYFPPMFFVGVRF